MEYIYFVDFICRVSVAIAVLDWSLITNIGCLVVVLNAYSPSNELAYVPGI
ncbi:MAG: hypothetical protein WCH65_01230 [bacterium]